MKRHIKVPCSQRLVLEVTLQPYVSPDTDLTNLTFEFLNQTTTFKSTIDWNYSVLGKLWCYNLNYFDFLWLSGSNVATNVAVIRNFIASLNADCIGLDPYPISLRMVNWIKFLSINHIKEAEIDEALYRQLLILNDSKEYHLMGNHLLENGFSLLFGAYYFNSNNLYQSACQILEYGLHNQILKDGGHYELSPMYHQIILGRVLDCCFLIKRNQNLFDNQILLLLENTASKMISWMNRITFSDGTIPYLNDSAPNIGFETKSLNKVAEILDIKRTQLPLGDSGYRKFEISPYNDSLIEVIIDIGSIQANEQPGHTHSDIFNFILTKDGAPFVVDTGISTYNIGSVRSNERSTQAHNTVSLSRVEPIEVWKGFRVGRRPKIAILEDSKARVSAYHDGYKSVGDLHKRTWTFGKRSIKIEDEIMGNSKSNYSLNLHFHPSVKIINRHKNVLKTDRAVLSFSSNDYQINEYQQAIAFNQTETAYKIVSDFRRSHKVEITF